MSFAFIQVVRFNNLTILICDLFAMCIQASASTVLKSIIDKPRKHRSSEKTVPILGVPCDAVEVFVGFLYSNKLVPNHKPTILFVYYIFIIYYSYIILL